MLGSRPDASGSVESEITPPAAFPHVADAFDRSTCSDVAVPRSIRSSEVRPSGSVSGKPSIITRTPRIVPALDRSPAPRAPKPRIVIRRSTPPERDCASTPGTRRKA
ncbi:MAG: hypothetical protein V9E87_11580 [Gemmatimonadales bacterium]